MSNIIKLTSEEHKMFHREEVLVVDGKEIEFEIIEEYRNENEHSIDYETIIKIGDKYYRYIAVATRYGYKDYVYESYAQHETNLIEVEKREIIRTIWVNKK